MNCKTNILLVIISAIFLSSCVSMQESDENDFSSKRKEKIAELNEICDFVTIDYVQGQEVYYCHKNGSRVRSNKSSEQQLVIEGDSEEVNEKENIESPADG